jgi:hypothetical protein
MFGRLLEYLGGLWRGYRPDEERGSRFNVAAIVLNLTGRAQTSRDFRWKQTRLRTCLEVVELNLADLKATALLRQVASGRASRCVLPWMAVMTGGGDSANIRRWLRLASQEPSRQRRADFAVVALTLAEAAGHKGVWQQALEGWDVTESTVANEFIALGKMTMCRANLRDLLQDRFGPLPEALRQRIEAATDLERLQAAVRQVHCLQSLDQLQL